jgi:uncharacterized protein (DUF1501 family)
MKRRDFIKKGIPLAVAPIIGTQTFASLMNPLELSEGTLSALATNPNRILVIINLSGGNDGLATIIHNNDITTLSGLRSSISNYGDFVSFGNGGYKINPNISQIAQNGLMSGANCAIINGVGLATANPSHFCAQDVWQCGSATYSDSVSGNGWIGKFFNENQNIYQGLLDPWAVQVGGSLPRAFMHPNFDKYYLLHSAYTGGNLRTSPLPNDCSKTNVNKELEFLRTAFSNTDVFNSRVKAAYTHTYNNNIGATYDVTNPNAPVDAITASFRSAMKTVARLIRGGLKAKIYSVTLNGFDTHTNQLDNHNTLLRGLSTAITGFQADMNFNYPDSDGNIMNLADRVLGMTYSEFGRRIMSNGTGTDHGTAGPMFLFGKKVYDGMKGIGGLTGITSPITISTNTHLECDYRTVYSAILEKWFGMSSALNIISPPSSNTNLISKNLITGLIS